MAKCNISVGRVNSNTEEGNYFVVRIQNRKEKIDLEVKLNAEQFANMLTGMMVDDAELNDRINPK